MSNKLKVSLPPIGSFLTERFLDCRYSNPEDPASKATSTHLGARIAYHIASHSGLYIMKTYGELAELFCVSSSAIKSSLGGLRKAEIIEVRTTRISREVDGMLQDFRGGNVTSLVKAPVNWYCSDKYIVNESTARAVVRARSYAMAAMQKANPNLFFDQAFIATGKLEFCTKENIPKHRVDFYTCSGQKRSSLGLKTTQHKELNKDLYKVLKKENYLRPVQGEEEGVFYSENVSGNETPEPKQEETPTTNKTNELTQEETGDNIDPETTQEDQTMIPKHPKLAGKAKPESKKSVSATELAAKLESGERVRPEYGTKSNVFAPTNKNALKDACRAINRKAIPTGTGAPHYSHTAFLEGLAKAISSRRNERHANYTEAVRMTAFALKNYAAYYSFLSQGSSQSINPNINLKVIYRSANIEDLIAFAAKESSRYASFNVKEWAGQAESKRQAHFDRAPANPTGKAPALPTNRKTEGKAPTKPSGNVVMNDIAAEILGGN